MIIKTKTYSAQKYKYLIEYIMSDKGRVQEDKTFTIHHNLRSTDTDEVIKEFITNDSFRKKRKGGIVLYHEVLSYSPEDKDKLSIELLEDIAQEFIRLRGDKALCLSKPHVENENIHIHFCFSGTEYRDSKALRLSKQDFKQVRLDLEIYQQERYPELGSIVYLNKWQKDKVQEQEQMKVSDAEYQIKKRTGNRSDKETVSSLIHECFEKSESRDNFYQRLINEGLSLYKYRNKTKGLLYNNRKYRFTTLNLSEKQFAHLEKGDRRMDELKRIMDKKSREQELER